MSLIAVGAAAAAVSAFAQEGTTPATEPVAAPAPAAPAPAEPAAAAPEAPATTAVPATPGPEVTAEPAPTAPADPAPATPMVEPAAPAAVVGTALAPAAPAPAADPAAPIVETAPAPYVAPYVAPEPIVEAPPPPPPPPTDPATIAVLNAVERVCMPLVKGGDVKALTTPLGYRKKKDLYTVVVAKPYQVTVMPQGTNKNVCTLEVDYPINGVEPMVVGLHNWAMARGWTLYRNDKYVTDLERHTRSWELAGPTENQALVLVAIRKANGATMTRNADRATILYSVTPAAPPAQ